MRLLAAAAFGCFVLLPCLAASAQPPAAEQQPPRGDRSGWYYEPGYEKPTPLMIIHQKARMRAMARLRRMEAMAAYGMSNARPTASATPHTGMYSPAWQMPGGRPFAWYTHRAPAYYLWR
ncbi:MAG: hypothetical protein AAF790_06390 [Planctomycetota bacterium]